MSSLKQFVAESVPGRVRGVDNGLPVCLDQFIGRQPELAQLRDAISRTRLLTLTGPPGVGKSRLAMELVRLVKDRYSGGTQWVDGARVASRTLMHEARKGRLGNASRPQRLVIIDNCEPIDGNAAQVVHEILCGSPDVTVLATSQDPLGLPGELTWAVQPMDIWVQDADSSSAMHLFACRAEAAAGHRPISMREYASVPEICRELDGIPLAIEVAAGQMRTLHAHEVLNLVNSRDVLDLPLPAGHHRFRSLREIHRDAYARLPSDEQLALRAVTVFPGTFDLAAANAVISNQHPELRPATIVNALARSFLVRRVQTAERATRFELYKLARKFVTDLLDPQEWDEAAAYHAQYFLLLAESAAPKLDGPETSVWIRKLQRNSHNFQATLEWLLSRHPPEAVRLAIALGPYHAARNQFAAGRAQLNSALTNLTGDEVLRARAKYWTGYFAMFQRDDADAEAAFRAALRWAQRAGDDSLASRCLQGLATVFQFAGDLDKAQQFADNALHLATKASDSVACAAAMNRLGYLVYLRRDYPRALTILIRALRASRRAGSIRRSAIVLTNLGELAVSRNQLRLAHKFLRDADTIWQQIGDDYSRASNLEAIGYLELRSGRLAECARTLREVGHALRRIGHDVPTDVLEIAAMFAEAMGRHARAVTLGAAAAIRRGKGRMRGFAEDPATYNRTLASARDAIGHRASIEADSEGQALTFAEAIALACDEHETDAEHFSHTSVLSPREHQVARSVACGFSNRYIANQLGISPSTVEVHLENIRRKLGFRSRTQVAVWFATGAREGQLPE